MTCDKSTMVVGGLYNWKNQPERLVYMGKEDAWHQFRKTDSYDVWCEVRDEGLHMLEKTVQDA